MRRISLTVIVFALIINANAQPPKTILIDANRLAEVKKHAQQKDNYSLQLIDSLKKQADGLLKMKPVSVMDKAFTPVSGSKHDYMSQAPYFWYDSTKTNGLPYMRKDGQRNPEINKITDHKYFADLDNAARVLSLAYYFTGEEKYAEKAAGLLRYWFFGEATKMNPNLDYAQAVPGVNTGRGIGIIESRSLVGIADAVGLLQGSKSWTPTDTKNLQQWYVQFLNWMLTSKNGKEENAAKNNHGTWYSVQAIDYALFTGNKEKAKQLSEESKRRIDSQFTKDGQQPLELARTNALGYSTMNLRGWCDLATLAEKTGVDLWHYQNASGAGIRTAIEWLMPYATGEKPWTYQQISKYNRFDFYPILFEAGNKYKAKDLLLNTFTLGKDVNDWLTKLIYSTFSRRI